MSVASAGAPADAPAFEPAPTDPWQRWGWLVYGIWLVFLGFPLIAVLDPALPTWQNVLGVAAVVGYGAVYLWGFAHADPDPEAPHPWWHLAGMVVLIGLTWSVIGIDALGMSPFVVSLAMFTTTIRAAGAVAAGTLLACLLLPPLLGQPVLMLYALIVTLVGVGTGTIRLLEAQEATQRRREEEANLAAQRDRVARDVHDVLGHSLTVVTVKAELAERLVEVDPEAAQAQLREIQSLTRQALAEIRATVAGLRVARLTDELAAAEEALADAGIEATTDADPAVVDPRHRIVLAWALREAVTNVVRHSGATRCTVELGEDWLRVRDDGRGRTGRREGNGLRGLRERVAAAGGSVDLADGHAADDRTGTELTVRMGTP